MPEFSRVSYVEIVRDPVWGEIPLTRQESDILHTSAFTRMRHIKQMGLAYLAFAGANHCRYEHCLGAMRASYLLLQMIESSAVVYDWQAVANLRMAVLLHDIGHPPFSHAVEETFRKYPNILGIIKNKRTKYCTKLKSLLGRDMRYSHEIFTKHIIERNQDIKRIVAANGANPSEIANLSIGKATSDILKTLNPLVSGDFDADRIDYIMRDSYYCGLAHKIQVGEFRNKILIEKTPNNDRYKIVVLPDAVPAINSLLLARYKLQKEVHSHSLNRVATQMIIEKTRLWLEGLQPEARAETIYKMTTEYTDYDLINQLRSVSEGPDIKAILRGDLYEGETTLPFKKMHPAVKASANMVMTDLTQIAEIQRQLRLDFKSSELLFDIQGPKPPKFRTMVRITREIEGKEKAEDKNIFSHYYTPLGILNDSFNELNAYIYCPRSNKKTFKDKVWEEILENTAEVPYRYHQLLNRTESCIARRIVQGARNVRDAKAKTKAIDRCDLLMVIFMAIQDKIGPEIGDGDVWLRSDQATQNFIYKLEKHLTNKKHVKIFKPWVWDESGFSTELFSDLERLINMGLMDHIHKHTPYSPSGFWGFRIDRKISGWGKDCVKNELQGNYSHLYDIVEKQLTPHVENFRLINKLQKAKGEAQGEMATRGKIIEQINDLRSHIISAGGPIISLG